jgi:hypothetical protein
MDDQPTSSHDPFDYLEDGPMQMPRQRSTEAHVESVSGDSTDSSNPPGRTDTFDGRNSSSKQKTGRGSLRSDEYQLEQFDVEGMSGVSDLPTGLLGRSGTFESVDTYSSGPPLRRNTFDSDAGWSELGPSTKMVSFQLQDEDLRGERLVAARKKLGVMRSKLRDAESAGDVQLASDLRLYAIPDIEATIARLDHPPDDDDDSPEKHDEEVPRMGQRLRNRKESRESLTGASTTRKSWNTPDIGMDEDSDNESEVDYDFEDKRSRFDFELSESEETRLDTDDDDLDSSTIAGTSDDREENSAFVGLKPTRAIQIHDAVYTGSATASGVHSAELISTENPRPNRFSLFRWM